MKMDMYIGMNYDDDDGEWENCYIECFFDAARNFHKKKRIKTERVLCKCSVILLLVYQNDFIDDVMFITICSIANRFSPPIGCRQTFWCFVYR